jgi:NAD(P)-dependent dehydrogenase (short-subunit alcohol dehydrogenase family)
MSKKVWFITGASRGFGRIWAEAALACGDKVAATARKLDVRALFDANYFGYLRGTLLEPDAYATEFGLSGKRVPEMDVYSDL